MSVCVVHADIAILFMFIFSSFSSSTFHCLLAVKNIQSIVVPFRVPTSFLLFVSKTIYTYLLLCMFSRYNNNNVGIKVNMCRRRE